MSLSASSLPLAQSLKLLGQTQLCKSFIHNDHEGKLDMRFIYNISTENDKYHICCYKTLVAEKEHELEEKKKLAKEIFVQNRQQTSYRVCLEFAQEVLEIEQEEEKKLRETFKKL